MNIQNFTISRRIWVLAGQFTLLVLLVGGFSEWNTVRLSGELDSLAHSHIVAAREMAVVDMYHDGLAAKVYKTLEFTTQKDNIELGAAADVVPLPSIAYHLFKPFNQPVQITP